MSDATQLVRHCRALLTEIAREITEFEARTAGPVTDLQHLHGAQVRLHQQRDVMRKHNGKEAI